MFCGIEKKIEIMKDHGLWANVKIAKESELLTMTSTDPKTVCSWKKVESDITEATEVTNDNIQEYWAL